MQGRRSVWFLPFLVFSIVALIVSCHVRAAGTIVVKSTSFEEGKAIPKKHTCDGEDVSPQLSWTGVPAGTKSMAVICDDPDAPAGTWVHWVIYNLPGDSTGIGENVPPREVLPNGAKQGKNDFRKIGYNGPCPPGGTHRYFFKVYALDTLVDLPAGATKAELVRAMEGHVLAQGSVMGTYSRK